MRVLTLTILLFLLPVPGFSGTGLAELDRKQVADLKSRLSELLRKKHALGLREFIQDLDGLAGEEVVKLVFPAALRVTSADNYKLAVRVLSKKDDEASVAFMVKLATNSRKSKKVNVLYRQLVVDAMSARSDDESFQRILALAKDTSAHHILRISAIKGLVERKRKEAIPVLIDVVAERDESPDRIWLDARQGLRALTGRDFSVVRDWKNFWESSKDKIDPLRIPESRRESKTVVGKGQVGFFGQALHSNNLIFVVDISSSMLKYDLQDDYKGRNPERDLNRLYLAQKQLVKTLKSLPKSVSFNIVAYSDRAIPWKRSLQKASSSSVSSAVRFVSSLKATGFTHTDEALKMAFSDPNVDTIILLSDGAPAKKTSLNSLEIIETTLAWLDQATVSRRIRIDTFGITGVGKWPRVIPGFSGTPPPPPSEFEVASFIDFMQQIAEKTDGLFRPLK